MSKKNLDVTVYVRYTTEDYNNLKLKADSLGLGVSTYVRMITLKSLK